MKLWRVIVLSAACLFLPGCGAEEAAGPAPEDAARAAYAALLSGDGSWLRGCNPNLAQSWEEYLVPRGELEYILLDLDGDSVPELLVQEADFPGSYNAVFHYEEGTLACWQNDSMEMSCYDYPLRDGTMVRQYDHGGATSYTLFRYQSGGEREEAAVLYARTAPDNEGDLRPCPYYSIDGEGVEEALFSAQLEKLVTAQMLDRAAWTPVEPPA